MKKYIIALITLLVLFGCSEQNQIVEPDLSSSAGSSFEFLKLPAPASSSLFKVHQASKSITNSDGGIISINDEYTAADGRLVKVIASIEFPSNAFYGPADLTYDISVALDDATTSESFYPHMTFNNYPVYNVRYEGLDLSGVNPEQVQFLYKGDDGSTEQLESDPVIIDQNSGTLEVTNVKIPHFSRYGFGN